MYVIFEMFSNVFQFILKVQLSSHSYNMGTDLDDKVHTPFTQLIDF